MAWMKEEELHLEMKPIADQCKTFQHTTQKPMVRHYKPEYEDYTKQLATDYQK
jgi:hypothetical protein